MGSQRGRTQWNALVEDLWRLQRKWEAKKANLVERGRSLRAHGIVFGIETGRRRLAEEKASSLSELEALLAEWESIGNLKASGAAAESIKGIDFGIRVVVGRLRRYLKRVARAKPPAVAPFDRSRRHPPARPRAS